MGTAKTRPVPRNALHRALARYAEATAREQEVLQCMHAEMEEVANRYRDSLEALADSRRRATDAVREQAEVLGPDSLGPTPGGAYITGLPSDPAKFFITLPSARNPFRATPLCRPL